MSTVNIKRSPTKPGPGWIEIDEDKIPTFLKLISNVQAALENIKKTEKDLGPSSENR